MNKDIFIKPKLTAIQKICLAGLFIALTTIFQKVTAINYIAVLPFLRISIGGPAMIIFSSITLGPWYGLLVGAASDILGYFIFDMSGYGFFPQITAIYALLGFVSYFVFHLFRQIKNKKIIFTIQLASIVLMICGITAFLFTRDTMQLYSTTYEINILTRILVPCILLALSAAMIASILFINKKKKDEFPLANTFSLSFACFILEVFVMVLFGCLMKALAFGFQTYIVILITQIIVLFFNIPINTVVVSLLLRLMERYYK